MTESSVSIEVGIIGAGIAGLAAAAGLRRAGHRVELFEASSFRSEVGAAITITPNGAKVLRHWGVDPGADAVKSEGIRLVDHGTLEIVFGDDFKGFQEDYGDELWHYHRVDLHQTIRELAISDKDGPSATINLGSPVKDIDPDKGLIMLQSGRTIKKDLIIVADGIKSNHLPRIVENPPTLRKNGESAFRALVPFSSINQNPALASIFAHTPHGFWAPFQKQPQKRLFVVTYPCRALELLNIAIIHTTLPRYSGHEDWHDPASIDDVLEALEDFDPLIKDLLKLAPEIKVYTLFCRDPLPNFHKGRAIIIGDAAAIMQPQHAQGATIALEEGAALEVLFSNVSGRHQVLERAQWYDELMGKRVQIIELSSNSPAGADSEARERLEAFMGKDKDTIPPKGSLQFSKPIRDFIWPHNILETGDRFMMSKGVRIST